MLNKTKPKKCRQHTYADGKQEYSEDNFTFGPGSPIPVSPWIPGGPVGPRSPCDQTPDNTQHMPLSPRSSLTPLFKGTFLKLKATIDICCVCTDIVCVRVRQLKCIVGDIWSLGAGWDGYKINLSVSNVSKSWNPNPNIWQQQCWKQPEFVMNHCIFAVCLSLEMTETNQHPPS